jgi:hypothetical protein
MKPRDPIWNLYDIFEESNKTTAKCKDCSAVVSAKVIRLRNHREKCPGLPNKPTEKRPEMIQETQPKSACSQQTTEPAPEPEENSIEPAAKRPRLYQPSINYYSISTDKTMTKHLDEQLAKLFYACNLPFNIADHPVWKETIQMLRPGYQPPNRKDIGGHLLDQVYDKITDKVMSELKGKETVLIQDGWSDIHNTPVIASSLQCENKAYFCLL